MTTKSVTELDAELNQMILAGNALEAFERFYSDEIVMQEGISTPREGKDANREYEQQFFAAIAEFHGAELHASSASDNCSHSEWTFDVTLKDGTRSTNTQVAARKWRDGQVVWERFYVAS